MFNLFKKCGAAASILSLSASALASTPVGLNQRVYNVPRGDLATIVGLEMNGTFVLRFDSGDLAGQVGGGWSRDDLATLSGCQNGLCTGESVYNVARQDFARVLGLQTNGNFVLQFTSGELNGLSGSGWSRGDLAIERGCSPSGNFCVGNRTFNVTRNAPAEIVAIQTSGKLVLRFTGGELNGLTGSGWSESDLAIVEQPAQPVPPLPPVVLPPAGRYYACTTTSNGRNFRVSAPTLAQARLGVINQCDRDPFTDKVSCARNSHCDL